MCSCTLKIGVVGQRHTTAALPPGNLPGTNRTRRWEGSRAGLDRCENLALIGLRSPDRPARS
jgi:hypothetical protein